MRRRTLSSVRPRLRGPLFQSLATGVLSQAVLVASGIIVARSLGPHDRGVLALLTILPALVTQIVSLGVPIAATYAIAAGGASARGLARTLRGTIGLQVGLAGAAQAALIAVLLLPRSPSGFLGVAVASLGLGVASLGQMYGLALLQGEQRFASFNALRVAPACLYVALVVCLATVNQARLTTIAVVLLLANVAVAAVTVVLAVRKSPRGERKRSSEQPPSVRSLTSFGIRAMFGAASPIASYRLDQLVVGAALAPDALGLYVVALAFTNLTRFLGQSIGVVAYPTIASDSDPSVQRRRIRGYFAVGAILCSAVTVVLVVAVPWLLPAFFGGVFASAVSPAQVLLVAGLFAGLRRILADATRGAGRPAWGTLAEVSTLIALPIALLAIETGAGLTGVAGALVLGDGIGLLVLLPALVTPNVTIRLTKERTVGAVVACATTVALLALACAIGYAVARAETRLMFVLCVGPVIGVGVMALRFWRMQTRVVTGHSESPCSSVGLLHLGVSRMFFFGGLLTMGLLTVRPAAGFTVSDWLFLGSALFALGYLLESDTAVQGLLPFGIRVGTLVFSLGALLTAVFIPDPWPTVSVVARMIYLLLLWLVLPPLLLTDRRQIIAAAACWVASSAIGASGAVIQLLYGNIIPGGYIASGRYTGFTDHANQLGELVATALPVALALFVFVLAHSARYRMAKLVGVVAVAGFLAAGLMLSGSVTGLLASAVGVLVFVMALRGVRLSVRLVTLSVAVLASTVLPSFLVTGYKTNPFQRLAGAGNANQSASYTANERIVGYRIAWHRIERDPLIGVGLAGPSATVTQDGVPLNVVHDTVLGSWHQAGIFGLVGILMIFGSLCNVARRAVARTAGASRALTAGLAASVAATLVLTLAQPILFNRFCWMALALLLAFDRDSAALVPSSARDAEGALSHGRPSLAATSPA